MPLLILRRGFRVGPYSLLATHIATFVRKASVSSGKTLSNSARISLLITACGMSSIPYYAMRTIDSAVFARRISQPTSIRVTPTSRTTSQLLRLLVWFFSPMLVVSMMAVSYTHLRAHETPEHLVCRLLLE